MKAQVKPCFYCKHMIDLENEAHVRVETLETVIKKKPKEYAHELCAAEFEAEMDRERAFEDMDLEYDLDEVEV